MELKKLAQNPLENLIENSPQKSNFIGLEKLAVGSQIGLSVDRPVDGQNSDRCASGRPAGDRGPRTESRALCQSTGPADRGFLESRSSLAVNRVDRPALQPELACTSVHIGRPTRSTDFKLGRPTRSTG